MRILIWALSLLATCFVLLAAFVYSSEDSIGKAHWDTLAIVQGYRWGLKDDQQVVEWITIDHGAAPSVAVSAVFLNFGIRYPQDFLQILRKVPAEKRAQVLDMLRFSLRGPGQDEAFQTSFGFPFAKLSELLAEQ